VVQLKKQNPKKNSMTAALLRERVSPWRENVTTVQQFLLQANADATPGHRTGQGGHQFTDFTRSIL
jgi:hypothetical protein